MYKKRVVFLFIILTACNFTAHHKNKKPEVDNDVKWSERMAKSIMTRADTLAYYIDRNPKWAYDVAFLGMAIDRLGNVDPSYSAYMKNWVDYFVQQDGSVTDYRKEEYNLDRIFPGRDVMILYRRNPQPKYKTALDNLIDQLRTHPRTKSGGYWHKKIYPWQMWLDGVFMGSTFMAEYAAEFNTPEWFDEAAKQAKMIYEKTLDSSSGLLMHAWDESREQKWCDPETGKSHYPWSRATGWYMIALVDILYCLPENHPDRGNLITILQKTCDALLKVRDPGTGLWFQVLNQGGREGNYIEGSGSAMFTYVFARGAHLGYLDKKYLDIADSSFNNIIDKLVSVDDDGLVTLHNICGACGLGGNPYRDGSFEYYVNEKRIDNDPKGVAPFIMAAIELDR
jgi:unsaturated rhamnogalacturonyl hydrolase